MMEKIKNHRKLSFDKKAIIVLGVTIPLITFVVFWIIPKWRFLLQSIQQIDPITGDAYFTLDNFTRFFDAVKNPYSEIFLSFKNTIICFCFDTFIKTPICFIFAFFLYKKIKFSNFFRWVFFLPSILSGVVVSGFVMSFLGVLGPFPGWIQAIFGGDKILFFQDEKYAFGTLLVVNLWSGFGVSLLYYVSAMVRIPEEVVESAKLDGFSLFHEFIYITIPLVWPTISTLLLLSVTAIWGSDVGSLLYTNGRAGTSTLNYWIYNNTVGGEYNYVSAVGMILTLITIPLIIIVRKLSAKIETATY